jgi:hypothetical protein
MLVGRIQVVSVFGPGYPKDKYLYVAEVLEGSVATGDILFGYPVLHVDGGGLVRKGQFTTWANVYLGELVFDVGSTMCVYYKFPGIPLDCEHIVADEVALTVSEIFRECARQFEPGSEPYKVLAQECCKWEDKAGALPF